MGGKESDMPKLSVEDTGQISHVGNYGAGNTSAYYRCVTRNIAVQSGVDWKLLAAEAMLVHELVHHRQCLDGRWTERSGGPRDTCLTETPAYQAQLAHVERGYAARPASERATWAKWLEDYRAYVERAIRWHREIGGC